MFFEIINIEHSYYIQLAFAFRNIIITQYVYSNETITVGNDGSKK